MIVEDSRILLQNLLKGILPTNEDGMFADLTNDFIWSGWVTRLTEGPSQVRENILLVRPPIKD
jgi:hypothetical protein